MKLLTYTSNKTKIIFEPKGDGTLPSGMIEAKYGQNSTYLKDHVFPYRLFDHKFVREVTEEERKEYEDLLSSNEWKFEDEFLK